MPAQELTGKGLHPRAEQALLAPSTERKAAECQPWAPAGAVTDASAWLPIGQQGVPGMDTSTTAGSGCRQSGTEECRLAAVPWHPAVQQLPRCLLALPEH